MDFFNLNMILFNFAHLPSIISHIKHLALRKQEKCILNENRLTLPHPIISKKNTSYGFNGFLVEFYGGVELNFIDKC